MADAVEGLTAQDSHVAGYVIEEGKGLIVAVNKWDLVADKTDDDLARLRRGGHDYRKMYAAYSAAVATRELPTVILAKTVKGWTLPGLAGRNVTHQKKELDEKMKDPDFRFPSAGDFGRAARQQALLIGLKTKILSVSSLPKLLPLIGTLLKNVRSNLDLKLIESLLTVYPDLNTFAIKSFTLNQKELLTFSASANGQSILIPVLGENNFTALHQFITQSFILPALSPTP